jgi:hypothetical protein
MKTGIRIAKVGTNIETWIEDGGELSYTRCQSVPIMKRSQDNEPYVFVLSTKNIKDRQGFRYTTDLDIHSLKFSLAQDLLPELAHQE